MERRAIRQLPCRSPDCASQMLPFAIEQGATITLGARRTGGPNRTMQVLSEPCDLAGELPLHREFSESDLQCPACKAGRDTIVEAETTASSPARETGMRWLLCNPACRQRLLPEPFACIICLLISSLACGGRVIEVVRRVVISVFPMPSFLVEKFR